MTDRPIIFSAPMVRALLAGCKTQTRRLIKLPTKTHNGGPIYERSDMGGWEATTHGGAGCFTFGTNGQRIPVPERPGLWHRTTGTCVGVGYAVGDRLYVREAFSLDFGGGSSVGGVGEWSYELQYRADRTTAEFSHEGHYEADPYSELADRQIGNWRPSIHMPRWASRLMLLVEDVRVERLQAISEEDAIAEGTSCYICGSGPVDGTSEHDCGCFHSRDLAVPSFRYLWETLHGPESWDANPWVVAVTFRVERANIDRKSA